MDLKSTQPIKIILYILEAIRINIHGKLTIIIFFKKNVQQFVKPMILKDIFSLCNNLTLKT